MWHHIIPKHEWKKRFSDCVGIDAPDNLVWLSLEQHIQVHQRYFLDRGLVGDRAAFLGLSGMIGKEEVIRLVNLGNQYALGNKHSVETKQIISERHTGNQYNIGRKHTEVTKKKMAASHVGNSSAKGKKMPPRTKEYRLAISVRQLGSKRRPYDKGIE